MNNIDELSNKIADIVSLLSTLKIEAEAIDSKRKALESSSYANTDREKRLNLTAQNQAQERKDLDSQKAYIEEQTAKNGQILASITKEKEYLIVSKAEKDQFTKDSAYLEVREKALEEKTLQLEKEKALMNKQNEAINQYQELLDAREKRIKAREAHLQMLAEA